MPRTTPSSEERAVLLFSVARDVSFSPEYFAIPNNGLQFPLYIQSIFGLSRCKQCNESNLFKDRKQILTTSRQSNNTNRYCFC